MNYTELLKQANNLRNDGKITEAIKIYAKIVQLAENEKNTPVIAESWHMAGVSAEMGIGGEDEFYHSALNSYSHAERAYTLIGDSVGLGAVCRDVGKAYTKVKKLPEAEEWLTRSVEILKMTDAFGQLGISYDKLGNYYTVVKDFDKAKECFTEALETFKQEPTAGFFRATTLHDFAKAYANNGEDGQAKDLAEESLSWFMADHGSETYDYRLAELNGLLSVVYYRLNEPQKAKAAGQKYEELIKGMAPEAARNITKTLSELAS